MRYLLDTNILLHYLRNTPLSIQIDKQFEPLNWVNHQSLLSIVSLGEIKSIAKMNKWGIGKINAIDTILEDILVTDINSEDLIERYAMIDAFSQGKLEGYSLKSSAKNMGKNDLWIAATASVLDAKLLTTDKDFEHLDSIFLDVICINPVI